VKKTLTIYSFEDFLLAEKSIANQETTKSNGTRTKHSLSAQWWV